MNLSNFFVRGFDSGVATPTQARRRWRPLAWTTEALRRALPQACALCTAACGQRLLCPDCTRAMPVPIAPCMQCALPSIRGAICGACLARPPPFAGTVAAWSYVFPVDCLMQAFKYGRRLALAEPLADALARSVCAAGAARPDAVVALPLTRGREAERGFNQAHEIARRVAAAVGVPQIHGLLRPRDAPPQASLAVGERARNVRNAFVATSEIAGRRVALVDDVMTTGATLRDAARALRQAGAVEVCAWVVARTPSPGDVPMT